MKYLSLAMTAVIAAGGAAVVALVLLSGRQDDRVVDQGAMPGRGGQRSQAGDPVHGGISLPGFPQGPAVPQGSVKGAGAARLHPLLGPLPEQIPAHSPGTSLPPGLDPVQIEKARDDNVRTVIEIERERLAKEIAMFEAIMGPLQQDNARRFLDVYYRHYDEAWRDFSDRVTRGETPDRKQVYRDARERAYAKLDGILDPVQLDLFRKWWEEECRDGN